MRLKRNLVAAGLAAAAIAALAPATLSAAAPAAPVSAVAAAPYCGIRWGSLPKIDSGYRGASIVNVRSGRHACFDRLVVDFNAKADGHRVEYVSQVISDPVGEVVPLRGGARLQIIAIGRTYDDEYQPTYRPANRRELVNVAGYRTLRQVSWAGSFEGQTTFGVGVRARLPFRVFTLDGPGAGSRLVIDVAHRW
jgi:hypothetical protein